MKRMVVSLWCAGLASALFAGQANPPAKKAAATKATAPTKSQVPAGITPAILARHVPEQFTNGATEVRVLSDSGNCRLVRKAGAWQVVAQDCAKKFAAGEFMYVGVLKSGSRVSPGVVASAEGGSTIAVSIQLDKNGRKVENEVP